MAEKKKDERTTARTEVEKALVKALSADMGEIPEVSITVEELKQLAAADKKKRKKRAMKYASVAAVAVIVWATVVFMAWPETVVPVDADKNTEQRVETGDGEIVINEGDGIGESGITEITETDWEKVSQYRKDFPALMNPTYIPEKYKFKILNIEKYSKDEFYACYTYEKEKKKLLIEQRIYRGDATRSSFLTEGTQTTKSKIGTAYIIPKEEDTTLVIVNLKNGDVSVKGELDIDELIQILDNIEIEMP